MRADSLFNEGLQRARTSDYLSAFALLRQSLALDADRAETCRLLGKVCLQLGRTDEAEACWERALALEPSDNESALCLRVLGRHRLIRRAFVVAALFILAVIVATASWRHYSSLSRMESSLARLEMRLDESGRPEGPEKATAAAPIAPVPEPIPPQAPERIAPPVPKPAPPPISTTKRSPAPKAEPSLPPATVHEMRIAFTDRYKTALSAALAGQLAKARGLFEPLASGAYAEEPLAGNVHFWLGRCLFELGETSAALERFNHVLTNYPRSPKTGDSILDIGRCHYRLGNPEKARQAWQQLLDGRYEARVKEAARRLLREAGF